MIARIIAFFRTLLALIFWIVFIPPAALLAFPWTLITGKVDFLYWLGMSLTLAGPKVAGVKVELVGLDKIDPAGTYIFMSNHVSNLDPPILVPLIPGRTSVLAKKEIWKIPIVNKALDLAEIVPVERMNRDSAISSIRRTDG
jgi:1-acyl-sn-glycerol-3-phosphate acyltransferase